MTALAGTDGSAVLEGSGAGHHPGTRVSKILFLPCSPELAVVDTVPLGVPHSLVQHLTVTDTQLGLNASFWVRRGVRVAHGR